MTAIKKYKISGFDNCQTEALATQTGPAESMKCKHVDVRISTNQTSPPELIIIAGRERAACMRALPVSAPATVYNYVY